MPTGSEFDIAGNIEHQFRFFSARIVLDLYRIN